MKAILLAVSLLMLVSSPAFSQGGGFGSNKARPQATPAPSHEKKEYPPLQYPVDDDALCRLNPVSCNSGSFGPRSPFGN